MDTNQTRNRCWNRLPHRTRTTDQIQNQIQTVVKSFCGVCGQVIHPSLQSVETSRCDAWMAADAANLGGGQ